MKWPAFVLVLPFALACQVARQPVPPGGGGRLLGIAHMALFVSDLNKSRAFYRDFLGFEEAYKLPKPDGSDRIAFIKVNDQQYIELFVDPPRGEGQLNHISFHTDDVDALRLRLGARGVKVPAEANKGRVGNRQFNITDPDGHTVELVQYQPDGWTRRDAGKFMPAGRVASHIAHLGVVTGPLQPMLRFYGEILGFKETWRGGPSDKVLSWINLRVPDGEDYLELMLTDQLPPPAERGGKNHICLVVPDIQKAVALLEARPTRKSYPRAIEIRVGVNRKRQANLFDPDGTRVELMEPTTVDGKPTPPSKAPPPR